MSKLYVLNGLDAGKSFQLKEGSNFLGRAFENDIRLQDKSVSRQHVRIEKAAERYFLTDLQSKNGTFLDGRYLLPGTEREVHEGMPIAIGMTVVAIGESAMTLTTPFLESIGLTGEIGQEMSIPVDPAMAIRLIPPPCSDPLRHPIPEHSATPP